MRVVEAVRLLGLRRRDGVDDLGNDWSSRISPSAGGLHSVRALGWSSEGSEPGVWFTELHVVEVMPDIADKLTSTIRIAIDRGPEIRTAIFAVASPDPALSKYGQNLGTTLLWRDAGAFLATAQGIATAGGLGSRIAGMAAPLPRLAQSRNRAAVLGAVALTGVPGVRP